MSADQDAESHSPSLSLKFSLITLGDNLTPAAKTARKSLRACARECAQTLNPILLATVSHLVSCNSGSRHKSYAWAATVRAANRAMLARMSSAVFVQTNGLESTFWASM